MNDVFGEPTPQDTKGETPIDQPRPEVVEQIKEEAAPPAADTEKHVPLAALEAERGQRRDWKEKALRLEGELKAAREFTQRQRQAPQEQTEYDPFQARLAQLETIALDASEQSARQAFGSETVDKALAKLQEAAPHLIQQALQQQNPWHFVVKEGKKLMLLDEIGDDPATYRARIEAEIRASMNAPVPKPVLPTSLATARSSASRGASTFNGPPPFDSMFPN